MGKKILIFLSLFYFATTISAAQQGISIVIDMPAQTASSESKEPQLTLLKNKLSQIKEHITFHKKLYIAATTIGLTTAIIAAIVGGYFYFSRTSQPCVGGTCVLDDGKKLDIKFLKTNHNDETSCAKNDAYDKFSISVDDKTTLKAFTCTANQKTNEFPVKGILVSNTETNASGDTVIQKLAEQTKSKVIETDIEKLSAAYNEARNNADTRYIIKLTNFEQQAKINRAETSQDTTAINQFLVDSGSQPKNVMLAATLNPRVEGQPDSAATRSDRFDLLITLDHKKEVLDQTFNHQIKKHHDIDAQKSVTQQQDACVKLPEDLILGAETKNNLVKAYCAAGTKNPSVTLLSGPPGNGKSTAAKELANADGWEFKEIGPRDLDKIDQYLNDTQEAKGRVILLDECDAWGNDPQKWLDILSKIQKESKISPIKVMAATNNPEKIGATIGSNNTRAVTIPYPENTSRRKLFNIFMPKDQTTLSEVEIKQVTDLSAGFSAADIKKTAQLAKMYSTLRDEPLSQVTFDDTIRGLYEVANKKYMLSL